MLAKKSKCQSCVVEIISKFNPFLASAGKATYLQNNNRKF